MQCPIISPYEKSCLSPTIFILCHQGELSKMQIYPCDILLKPLKLLPATFMIKSFFFRMPQGPFGISPLLSLPSPLIDVCFSSLKHVQAATNVSFSLCLWSFQCDNYFWFKCPDLLREIVQLIL